MLLFSRCTWQKLTCQAGLLEKKQAMHFCSSANVWVWSEIRRARGTAACKKYSLLYCLQCSILSSLFQSRTCKRESVPKPSSSSSCLCNVLALLCWAVKKTGLEMQLFTQVLCQALTMDVTDYLPQLLKWGQEGEGHRVLCSKSLPCHPMFNS